MTAATDTSRAPGGEESRHLRRDIGRVGLLFTGVGSIIGSGWLFGAMNASIIAGPAAIFSWAIAGLMIVFIGLSFSELGTMFPVTGGVVRFPMYAFGGFASYSMGWITWVAAAVVPAIETTGVLQYATKWYHFTDKHMVGGEPVHTLTPVGIGVALLLLAAFCVINAIGVRFFAQINNVLVWWKLIVIMVVVVAFLVTAFHAANFSDHGFAPAGGKAMLTAISTSGITFSYLGFRQAIELAGESDNPRRNVPFAVIGSVVLCMAIYVLLQIAFIGALSGGDLAHGWSKLSFTNDFGPLAAVSTAIGLGWLATVLYVDAVVSPGDTGLIYSAVTSRLGYTMARNGAAPAGIGKLSRRGVPWVSLIITFVVAAIMLLPFPSWQQLVGLVTSATVMSFGSGPLAHAALRRQLPDRHRPFRLWGGDTIPLLAFFSANLIIYWTGWNTNWKFFVIVLFGYVLMAIFAATGQLKHKMEWKAGASWVLPWLAGIALISYLGDYDGGRGVFKGLVMGFVVNAVWSVVIYIIAVKVRLPGDRVRAIIAELPHDEVDSEPALAD
ncbi:APC family permease [Actinoallomurus iriomotensis]|uniref:Amino acid permease n=1 Tax=Actinoallomurus iriomotensis TaxID=478107 RepID=A0A9W6S3I6_9ACTN|nr:APC family permease [Actinoallomurus iriomotensis]GLY87495.1 amino acid permease [Actinoallomurus iriomotensis]